MKGVVIFFTVVIIILICVFAYFATKNMHENFKTNNDSKHPCFNIKIDGNENHETEAVDNNCEIVKIGNTQFYAPKSCDKGDVIFASIKNDKSEISCKTCPTSMTSKDGKECTLTETKQVCADNQYEDLSNFKNDNFKQLDSKKINELKYHYSNYKPSDRKCKNFSKCSVNDSWVTNYNSLLDNAYTDINADISGNSMMGDIPNTDSNADKSGNSMTGDIPNTDSNDIIFSDISSSKKYFEDISCDTLTTRQSSQYFIDNEDNFNPDNLPNIPGTTQKVNITDRVFKPLATNCVKGHHISPKFTTASSELSGLNGYYASDRICDKCGDNTYTDKTNQVECVSQPTAPNGFGMPTDYVSNVDKYKKEVAITVQCDGDTNYSDENKHTPCKPHPTCVAGEKISSKNPNKARSCSTCPVNSYQNEHLHRVTKCEPQPTAPNGFGMPTDYVSYPNKYKKEVAITVQCDGDTNYSDENNHTPCKPHPTCVAGEKISSKNPNKARSCSTCPVNSYQNEHLHRVTKCEPQTPAPKGFGMPTDYVSDPNKYKKNAAITVQCDGDTNYSDENNHTPCKTHPVCGAGQIINETNPVAIRTCIDLSTDLCGDDIFPGCYMPHTNHRYEDYITRQACLDDSKVHVPECEDEFKYKGPCLHDSELRPTCPA